MGKPISQARDEVEAIAKLWAYSATLARHAYGDPHDMLGQDVLAMVVNESVGEVAMITPCNFPLLIISQKLPFALAVGCTAVVKPSELTSGTTVHLTKLLLEAGLPDGVATCLPATAASAAS